MRTWIMPSRRTQTATSRLFMALGVAALVAGAAAPIAAQAGATALDEGIRLYYERQWTAARQALLPVAEQNPRDARAALYVGRAFLEEGELDRATQWLERAVRLDPSSSQAHLHLATAYGQQAARAGLARQAILAGRTRTNLERAVALDGENATARFGLVQFYAFAPGIAGGSKAKAREQVAELRRRNPYFAALAAAMLHNSEGDAAAAEQELVTALRQYPDSAALYFSLGGVQSRQERWDEAFDTYEALLARRPRELGAALQIGRLGAISGQRLDRAEQALRLYLSQDPRPAPAQRVSAHWRLGMVLERQDRRDLARQEYEAALRLDPKHSGARDALRQLER